MTPNPRPISWMEKNFLVSRDELRVRNWTWQVLICDYWYETPFTFGV